MKILEGLDAAKFTEEFLKAYLQDGFTAMSKREVDLLILRLLVDHKEGWSWENPPNAFEMAKVLKAKRTRLRSMMDELSFRNQMDDEAAKERLQRIILDRVGPDSDATFEGATVRLQIEDGYLREFAKSLVQDDLGIVDTSFDRSIMTLSAPKFLGLVGTLVSDDTRSHMEAELAKHRDQLPKNDRQGIWKIFLESFVKSAGTELGKKAIKLGAAALTGGLSEVSEIIESIFENHSAPGQGDANGGILT